MAQYIVGLTGGIGSGKSTVARLFRERDIVVVDADVAARAVVEPGSPALAQISEKFGASIVDSGGSLDRKALRNIVFNDSVALSWLESLLHPLIRQWICEQLSSAKSPYAVLESPLLLETDQHKLVNRIVVVDIPEEKQLFRASQRDGQPVDSIRQIMAKQLSREGRMKLADSIIDNSGDTASLDAQVEHLHQHFLAQSIQKATTQ